MFTFLRFVAVLTILCAASAGFAQGVDDLFDDSEKEPLCECHHYTFSLENPPDWIPKAAKTALANAARPDESGWKGVVLFCPTTNAVIERFPLKRAYRFLVCPSDWQGFKPRRVTAETLIKNGIPIEKIREMFQSVVMGPLEVSFRARHSRGMMGSVEVEND